MQFFCAKTPEHINPFADNAWASMISAFIKSAFNKWPGIFLYHVSLHRTLTSNELKKVWSIKISSTPYHINFFIFLYWIGKISSFHQHAGSSSKCFAFKLEFPSLLTVSATNQKSSKPGWCNYCAKAAFCHKGRRYSYLNKWPWILII